MAMLRRKAVAAVTVRISASSLMQRGVSSGNPASVLTVMGVVMAFWPSLFSRFA